LVLLLITLNNAPVFFFANPTAPCSTNHFAYCQYLNGSACGQIASCQYCKPMALSVAVDCRRTVLYAAAMFVWAAAGLVISPFFYCLMSIDYVVRSATLQNVIAAVTHNFKAIGLTVCGSNDAIVLWPRGVWHDKDMRARVMLMKWLYLYGALTMSQLSMADECGSKYVLVPRIIKRLQTSTRP
jgi:hypothetical protein